MRAPVLVAIGCLLATASACGALIGIGDEPSFDPDEAGGGVDGSRDTSQSGGGDASPDRADAPNDVTTDAPDASDGCTGATLCEDFERDASAIFLEQDPDGVGFVTNAEARSPTHCFRSAVNPAPAAHAFFRLQAGTYAGGVDVSFYYHVISGFGVGATPIAELATTGTSYVVRVWLTPTAVQLEWWDTGANNGLGKATLAPRGVLPWNLVAFKVRALQVTNFGGANILGPQPQALGGSVEVHLGIVDNPQNQAASIDFDDVVVRPP